MTIAAVALGGAFGALARYLLMSALGRRLQGDFPFGTLAVNALGSFALGFLAGGLYSAESDPRLAAFVATGLLGGFTTFSTFALDIEALVKRHQKGQATLYLGVSLALSIGALAIGLALAGPTGP